MPQNSKEAYVPGGKLLINWIHLISDQSQVIESEKLSGQVRTRLGIFSGAVLTALKGNSPSKCIQRGFFFFTYTYILFLILFCYGLSQVIECISLCSTVGPCCLFILYIIVNLCIQHVLKSQLNLQYDCSRDLRNCRNNAPRAPVTEIESSKAQDGRETSSGVCTAAGSGL